MNVNADALSRNPIINDEKLKHLHEDDDDTFMTSQEKLNLENAINYENSPWKTMTTRSKEKKQEQMKNSNQHKNLENINQNEIQEKLDEKFSSKPLVKKHRGRPRKNLLTNLKIIPSQTKRKLSRPRKQI